MNKFYVIASLLGSLSATGVVPDGSAQQEYIKAVDTEKINKDVVDKLTAEVLNMNVKAIIDKEVQKRVKEILEDKELEDMHKFRSFSRQDWLKYDNLILQQKLENIMSSLGDNQTLDAMWKNTEQEKSDKALRKFTVSLDLDSKEIEIASKATDLNGNPIYDWKLDQQKGEIEHIKRQAIVNPTKVLEQQWKAQNPGNDIPHSSPVAVQPTPVTSTPTYDATSTAPLVVKKTIITGDVKKTQEDDDIEAQWENLELQRDLAFKIVYFFIFFIVATFGLLYAYFKIDEKEKMKEQKESRAKGEIYGNKNQSSFFDFLAGQMDDPHYTVNPYARTGVTQTLPKSKNQGEEKQMEEYCGAARNLDNL